MGSLKKIWDAVFRQQSRLHRDNKQLRQEFRRVGRTIDQLSNKVDALVQQQVLLEHANEHALKLRQELKRLGEELDSFEVGVKGRFHSLGWELKRLKQHNERLEGQLQALLRLAILDSDKLDYPHRLTTRRFGITSQNQEDGLSWSLLQEVGIVTKTFVEIGSGMSGGNSAFFARELGWRGLMIEGDAYKVKRIARRFPERVQGVAAWVTRDNVNELLRDNGYSGEVDFLSLDIDGIDYWVWETLDTCMPRVVAIEYNSSFGPDRSVVIPYGAKLERGDVDDSDRDWSRYYFGASLTALAKLGRRKGYRLVATEAGINAYFVRDDLAPVIPEISAASAYSIHESHNSLQQRKDESVYDFINRAGLPLVEV